MSVEWDAEERLESIIRKQVAEGNIASYGPERPVPGATSRAPRVAGHGNATVIGSNSRITIHIEVPLKVVADVHPGDTPLSETQAATIQRLVRQIARLSGVPHQRIYTRLLERQGVTRYRLIPAAAFGDAEAYLLSWLARAGGPPPIDDGTGDLRRRHLAYIKVNQKKAGRTDAELNAMLLGKFGVTGLSKCSLDQLADVRLVVKAWGRR